MDFCAKILREESIQNIICVADMTPGIHKVVFLPGRLPSCRVVSEKSTSVEGGTDMSTAG